jgi:hypothetical protein
MDKNKVVLAKASGKYMKMDTNKISSNFSHNDWFFVEKENPLYIELPENI